MSILKSRFHRQQEIAMREYFGWRTDWADSEFGSFSSLPAGREYPVHTKEDFASSQRLAVDRLRSVGHGQ